MTAGATPVRAKFWAIPMRSKTRLVLAIGCVSLFVLTIPALSLPSPVEKQIQTKQIQIKKAAPLNAKGARNKAAAKAAAVPRLTSM